MRTPVHPGEVLADELSERGLNANRLAAALHIPPNRISAILKGQRGVTADTALRLSRFFGVSAEFWMNLQDQYELDLSRRDSAKEIDALPTCEEFLGACA